MTTKKSSNVVHDDDKHFLWSQRQMPIPNPYPSWFSKQPHHVANMALKGHDQQILIKNIGLPKSSFTYVTSSKSPCSSTKKFYILSHCRNAWHSLSSEDCNWEWKSGFHFEPQTFMISHDSPSPMAPNQRVSPKTALAADKTHKVTFTNGNAVNLTTGKSYEETLDLNCTSTCHLDSCQWPPPVRRPIWLWLILWRISAIYVLQQAHFTWYMKKNKRK